MNPAARQIQRTYLLLTLGNTLAASLIWGINTLFLLDAGLSNLQAFAANAFFTAGMVLFEIPTGVVADVWGRRLSYQLGTLTLAISTVLYYLLWQYSAPFWQWALASVFIGLGFTFFSGAVEAWLVDAMAYAKFKGSLETVFGKAQMVSGVAMLTGSVAGGIIAQATNLGVPFLLRAGILLVMFYVASRVMRDLGFSPADEARPLHNMRQLLTTSLDYGIKNRPVRWVMLAAPFSAGVGIYTFYALQPFLLELYGNAHSYSIAGLAAAIVAGSQIAGGFLAPKIRGLFARRTSALIFGGLLSSAVLALLSLTHAFVVALLLLVIWGLLFSAVTPIRQTYINGMIPSKQRATVLSFDSLVSNVGGVVIQPALGRAADVYSYGTSYLFGAGLSLLSAPFLLASRREGHKADTVTTPVKTAE